jgi:hypothetical protein
MVDTNSMWLSAALIQSANTLNFTPVFASKGAIHILQGRVHFRCYVSLAPSRPLQGFLLFSASAFRLNWYNINYQMHKIYYNYSKVLLQQLQPISSLTGQSSGSAQSYKTIFQFSDYLFRSSTLLVHTGGREKFLQFSYAPLRPLIIFQWGPRYVGTDLLKWAFVDIHFYNTSSCSSAF